MRLDNQKCRFSKHIWFLKNKNFEINNKLKKQLIQKLDKIKNCVYCNSTKNLSLDHIIPLSKYVNNEIDNFVIACKSCNSSKHNKDVVIWAKEKGIKLSKMIIDYINSKQLILIN